MKAFKTIDYVGQLVLITVGVFSIAIFGFRYDRGPGISTYFLVGGWQVLSVLIHLFLKNVPKVNLRKIYHVLLIVTLVIGIPCLFSDAIIYYLVAVLIWSPVLAIIYVVCCYKEVKLMGETKSGGVVQEEELKTGQI